MLNGIQQADKFFQKYSMDRDKKLFKIQRKKNKDLKY